MTGKDGLDRERPFVPVISGQRIRGYLALEKIAEVRGGNIAWPIGSFSSSRRARYVSGDRALPRHGCSIASRRVAISGAKALIGQAARFIGRQAVQLRGGMGMTDRLDVSHCFKRLLAFELRMGLTDEPLEGCRENLRAAGLRQARKIWSKEKNDD